MADAAPAGEANPPVLASVFILFKAGVMGWAQGGWRQRANFSAHVQCCAAQGHVELFSKDAPARRGRQKASGARFSAHVQCCAKQW